MHCHRSDTRHAMARNCRTVKNVNVKFGKKMRHFISVVRICCAVEMKRQRYAAIRFVRHAEILFLQFARGGGRISRFRFQRARG